MSRTAIISISLTLMLSLVLDTVKLENDEDADELMFPDLVSSEVVSFHDGSARNALEVEPPFMRLRFHREKYK